MNAVLIIEQEMVSRMIFEFSPQDEAFRQEVRSFIRENLPADIAQRSYINSATEPMPTDHFRRWQRILADKGWGAPHWPVENGGTGWSAIQKHIFFEEVYRADALDVGWQALHMVAPVMIAFGSPEQKARFLPTMLRGEEFWCQGFSEPNAGSDLANLRTAAVLDGDHYVINGQKIWTSDASEAEWGFFLVRTDPDVKPQRGISFLLVDMRTPGITVRSIPSIEGGHGLHEVFLENVRVPKENLLGEAGKGWTYAKYLLDKERTSSAFLYFNKRELEKVKDVARHESIDGVALLDTPEFGRKAARLEVDMLALEWSVLRILANEKSNYDMNAVVSSLKIRGSEMQQRVTELAMDALGPRSLRFFGEDETKSASPRGTELWPMYVLGKSARFMIMRASTIYGGAREVQKNIIAKLAFGL
jgi:alkylation response protein AidB-like acyl-CoA dehydrogenase